MLVLMNQTMDKHLVFLSNYNMKELQRLLM